MNHYHNTNDMEENNMRVIVWFSCGAASAVSAILTLKKYPNAILVYADTGSEHPDNVRFMSDMERLLNREVVVLKSKEYTDIWDVFTKTRWLVGVNGARCTTELKKKVRQGYERDSDLQIFGYTIDEQHRVERFTNNNPEMNTWFPLIEKRMSKADCLEILNQHSIELPVLYKLGFKNNNCIPCVKGQAGYYNLIRKHFPEEFERMAKIERDLDVAINKSYAGDGERKRIFLDELDPTAGRYETEPAVSCGLFCGQYLEDEK